MFDQDTEILTQDGFKSINSIKDKEVVLMRNPSSLLDRLKEVEELDSFSYDKPLYYFKTRYWESPKFSEEVYLWTSKYNQHHGVLDEQTRRNDFVEYCDIKKKPLVFDHKIKFEETKDPTEVKIGSFVLDSEDFYFWLGIVATDGSLSKKKNTISISQCKEKNIPIIKDVSERLFGEKSKVYHYSREKQGLSDIYYFNIYSKPLHEWIVEKIGRTKEERRLKSIFNLSTRLLEKFLEGAILGDGWMVERVGEFSEGFNKGVFCGISEDLAKDYQVIASCLGCRSNVIIKDVIGKEYEFGDKIKHKIVSKNIQYKLSIHQEGSSCVKRDHHRKIEFNGELHYPIIGNNLIFIRRNGMAFWCGTT